MGTAPPTSMALNTHWLRMQDKPTDIDHSATGINRARGIDNGTSARRNAAGRQALRFQQLRDGIARVPELITTCPPASGFPILARSSLLADVSFGSICDLVQLLSNVCLLKAEQPGFAGLF